MAVMSAYQISLLFDKNISNDFGVTLLFSVLGNKQYISEIVQVTKGHNKISLPLASVSSISCKVFSSHDRERSGSVVECLTRDRGAAGWSLTSITVLWSLSKTHPSLVLVQPRKTHPCLAERLLMGHKESNQTKAHMLKVSYCHLRMSIIYQSGQPHGT